MPLSTYWFIGLVLSGVLAWRSNKGIQALLCAYWGVILLWSLGYVSWLTTTPLTWSALLNVQLSYHIDGLARVFTLLISGIGILIFIYAAIYARGKIHKRMKLLSLLQAFALGMWGIVITDNTLVLFLMWEITTLTSYLLIQFDVTNKRANQAAFNGMFISVLGALAMLAGFILLHQQSGSWSIQNAMHTLQHSTLLVPAFWLILLGAVTKSAQFPFYFWLPGAMQAPTPVSAYLHSATMVNAGIYLLARFHPLFSPLAEWYPALAFFGMSTMLVSGVLSLFQRDLKAILAYTTLFALGSMVYLLASNLWQAAEAFALFFVFHGLYKATAFMWVGTIDQTYGSRDIILLRGLGKRWPIASIVAIVSLGAMAGLPPFFGFVVKEMLYEAKLAGGSVSYDMMALSMVSSMLIAAASLKILYYWFTGRPQVGEPTPLRFGLLCALILTVLIVGLALIMPYLNPLIRGAADSVVAHRGTLASATSATSTWLSLATVCGGVVMFVFSQYLNRRTRTWPTWLNPLVLFERGVSASLAFGKWLTHITQDQPLSRQLVLMFAVALLWAASALLFAAHDHPIVLHWFRSTWSAAVFSVLLILTGISLLVSKRFLLNMVSFAVLGLMISGIFVAQGAPDVAMTQLLVEILTVIVLVIALRKAPLAHHPLTTRQHGFHLLIAVCTGIVVTILLFLVTSAPFNTTLSDYFIHNSLPLAHGHNVVNVILVDFRAFDTLGEALVILATALAIWLLIDKKLATKHQDKGPK